jgi:enoyl-CoA hydratase/carnithine racemase
MSLRFRSLHNRHFKISFPEERVLLVTIDRPEKLNCIDKTTSDEIADIWKCFDQDESIWVGIITGNGRAFCTGADLHGTPIHRLFNIKTRANSSMNTQSGMR